MNIDVLYWVEVFKYLGRVLSQDDDDMRGEGPNRESMQVLGTNQEGAEE